ncbi:MAG TPA: TetR/AcrR family transcriptional regulator [Cellvibrio sp.]|nr:TetR/AcrR family transcriptional regulator [Cellvibrio sp.]
MSRGRPKNFCRTDILEKALPVFWQNGFASTSLQLLEQATGVNKSGLYSEFESKDVLYTECIRHYLANGSSSEILNRQPLGWQNIEDFIRAAYCGESAQKGCFTVSSVRDFANIPDEACDMVGKCFSDLEAVILQNVQAETTRMDARPVAELIRIFFFGFCMELGWNTKKATADRKVKNFMQVLYSL